MHPEVQSSQPGSCPACGMALQSFRSSHETGEDPELKDMRRRLMVGLFLGGPVLLPHMLALLPGRFFSGMVLSPAFHLLEALLATPVLIWCGGPFFRRGARSLVARRLNMFTLISMGAGSAYLYSLVAVFLPGLFPAALRGSGGQVPSYFESALSIILLVLLGQVIEIRARSRAGQAIRQLLDLAPTSARRIKADGSDEHVALNRVRVGDQLRIRPGEKVPADGLILDGTSAVNESMITGEAIPAQKQRGDRVTGGTVNDAGSFIMEVRQIGEQSLLARIVRMVREAQQSRPPIQRLADSVAAWFVPAVMAIAGVTFLLWWFLGPAPQLAHALINAVAVLIIACPCALGLATPMSILVGAGRGAASGVLIRDAGVLEAMEKVNTLAVDKTGTLTEGKPVLHTVHALGTGPGEERILRLAAGLERGSEHPLATALLAAATVRHLQLAEAKGFQSFPGRGVKGEVEGHRILLGNLTLFKEQKIDPGPLPRLAEESRRRGATTLMVAVDGQPAGLISLKDPVRLKAASLIQALQAEGIRVIMVTGDGRITAEAVARQLGIAHVEAEVLPDQKARLVERLQAQGQRVAVAGDGINDAPALAQADAGIAMGTGTDLAMESAGAVLVKGDLGGILRLRHLSRAVMANIRQNLLLAFAYNLLALPLAAGILYPFMGLTLSPMVAAGAMSLSSVSVIGNALRLRQIDLP